MNLTVNKDIKSERKEKKILDNNFRNTLTLFVGLPKVFNNTSQTMHNY